MLCDVREIDHNERETIGAGGNVMKHEESMNEWLFENARLSMLCLVAVGCM